MRKDFKKDDTVFVGTAEMKSLTKTKISRVGRSLVFYLQYDPLNRPYEVSVPHSEQNKTELGGYKVGFSHKVLYPYSESIERIYEKQKK